MNTSAKDHLVNLTLLLKNLILVSNTMFGSYRVANTGTKRTFIAAPDAFVSPRMWLRRSELLEELVFDRLDENNGQLQQSVLTLNQTLMSHYEDVRKRNEAMQFRDLPPRILGGLSSALADIKVGAFNYTASPFSESLCSC